MRVQLNGEIVNDQDAWLYEFFDVPAFSPSMIRNALEANPEGEDLVLEVNSVGGNVFAGFEMYSVLRNATCHTVAEVQSMAASIASIIMLGCDEVQASPVAQVMVHLPLTTTMGNRYDHLDSINVLDSITESLLNAYTIKAGAKANRDEFRRQMKNETWMTAPEAKAMGIVDKITGEESIDPTVIINCAGGIRALATSSAKLSASDLRDRYEKLVAEGKAPERVGRKTIEPATPDNQTTHTENITEIEVARARLELEKIRFGGSL